MRERGFTLVELIMVIVVLGVLAVYAAPRFDRDGFDLGAARDELIEALRYAQQQSMSNTGAANFSVLLLAGGNGYAVQQGGVTVNDPANGTPYQRVWGNIGVAPAGTTITFGGRGETTAAFAITLSRGADTENVTVEDQTGYVW